MDDKQSLTQNIEYGENEPREEKHYQQRQARCTPPPVPIYPVLDAAHPSVSITLEDEPSRIPKDYSGIAWLSLLCCCFPLSIPAVLKADKVVKLVRRGEIQEANIQAEVTRKLSVLAIIFGITIIIIAISIYFLYKYYVQHSL